MKKSGPSCSRSRCGESSSSRAIPKASLVRPLSAARTVKKGEEGSKTLIVKGTDLGAIAARPLKETADPRSDQTYTLRGDETYDVAEPSSVMARSELVEFQRRVHRQQQALDESRDELDEKMRRLERELEDWQEEQDALDNEKRLLQRKLTQFEESVKVPNKPAKLSKSAVKPAAKTGSETDSKPADKTASKPGSRLRPPSPSIAVGKARSVVRPL